MGKNIIVTPFLQFINVLRNHYKQVQSLSFILILVLGYTTYNAGIINNVDAIGTWNGQNTLHVPISWCAMQGSPAVTSPNVPNPPGPADTSTDAILWRRHERPTDNIYINPTGITFRSAINNAWGTLNFPVIADPNTAQGVQGDVLNPTININEYNQALNSCITAWNNLGRGGIGIPAINIDLFHFNDGSYIQNGGVLLGFAGCTGWGTANICTSPYSGWIMVVDNHYMFPGIANRNFPGTNQQVSLTDPMDWLFGHEVGHALGLGTGFDAYDNTGHTTPNTALMFPSIQDNNNNDGQADNIAIRSSNPNEVGQLRTNSINVPGLEQDPLNKILKGDVVETDIAATLSLDDNVPPYLKNSIMRVVFDTKQNEISFGQQLLSVLPNDTRKLQYWTLVDTDADPMTGAHEGILKSLGVPPTKFKGSDLIVRSNVSGDRIAGQVWYMKENTLVELPTRLFRSELLTNTGVADYAPVKGGPKAIKPGLIAVNNIVSVTVNNDIAKIDLNKSFNIQTISAGEGFTVADKLDKGKEEGGIKFILEHPSFPQCFPRSDPKAGENVTIDIEGLKPNASIHGLLGPTTVFKGKADETGGGAIQFPIPSNATSGLHLVTIGIDDTALTADCEVNVLRPSQAKQVMWTNHFDLLPGDASVSTSFNAITSGVGGGLNGLVIQSNATGETSPGGGNKVVHMAVDVPPGYSIEGVRLCYELSKNSSYISQVRLSQVQDPPSNALVLLDDGTDLIDIGPICVNSQTTSVDPSLGAVLISLRVNFGDTSDRIVVRGLGLILS